MEVYRYLSIFWCLINILVVFSLLYESRFSKRTTWISNLVCIGGLIVLNMLLILQFGVITMGKFFIFTATIPSFFFFFFMSKDRNGRFFFTFCLVDIAGFWIMAVTNLISYAFGENHLLLLILRVILFLFIEYFTIRYFVRPYHKLLAYVKRGWGGFAAASGLIYLFFALMSGWPTRITERPGELPAFILFLIILPTVYFSIFILLYQQYKLNMKLQNENILESQLNIFQNQIRILNSSNEKNQILRHDIRHYITQIASSLKEGNKESALSYIRHFEGVYQESMVQHYCLNSTVNSVLAYYIGKAESELISVDSSFDLEEGMDIDEIEFCIMLSNAMENAIHACRKLPSAERKICVTCLSEPQLLFELANTCDPEQVLFDEEHNPLSTEPSHGIGTRSIQAFAQKHGAITDYQLEDHTFRLRILFPAKDSYL